MGMAESDQWCFELDEMQNSQYAGKVMAKGYAKRTLYGFLLCLSFGYTTTEISALL